MFKIFKKNTEDKNKAMSECSISTLLLVKNIISDVVEDIDLNLIVPEAELEILGLDSIKFLNILMCLEDALGMDLEDIVEKIDLTEINTIQNVIDLIEDIKET